VEGSLVEGSLVDGLLVDGSLVVGSLVVGAGALVVVSVEESVFEMLEVSTSQEARKRAARKQMSGASLFFITSYSIPLSKALEG
jgi:hypothetical protein